MKKSLNPTIIGRKWQTKLLGFSKTPKKIFWLRLCFQDHFDHFRRRIHTVQCRCDNRTNHGWYSTTFYDWADHKLYYDLERLSKTWRSFLGYESTTNTRLHKYTPIITHKNELITTRLIDSHKNPVIIINRNEIVEGFFQKLISFIVAY